MKNKEFPKLKFPMSPEQKAYVLQQYGTGMSLQKIHDLISSTDANVRPDDVDRYNGSFHTFRARVNRTLLKKVSPGRKKRSIKLDTVENKLKFISDIMMDENNKPEVKLRALELFSDLQKEAGLEEDGKVLIANPDRIKITPEFIKELIMMSRTDIGGLHTLDYDILDVAELTLLMQSVNTALRNKPDLTPNKATGKE